MPDNEEDDSEDSGFESDIWEEFVERVYRKGKRINPARVDNMKRTFEAKFGLDDLSEIHVRYSKIGFGDKFWSVVAKVKP